MMNDKYSDDLLDLKYEVAKMQVEITKLKEANKLLEKQRNEIQLAWQKLVRDLYQMQCD